VGLLKHPVINYAHILEKKHTLSNDVELCLCLVKSGAVWHSGESRKGKWKEGRRGEVWREGDVDVDVVVWEEEGYSIPNERMEDA
jgi:hypothetical protein